MFLVNTLCVKAETAYFYEAEYINGIYMNKYQYSTKTIYYQKARFFRKTDTNEFAYCIEPFQFFTNNASYEDTITPNNLSNEQIEQIAQIAHFGYGYQNHTDIKWYAITQMMIWQAADSSGDYYFTDSLNGKRINQYQNEIDEINTLIASYKKIPSFSNNSYSIVEDTTLILEDTNNILSSYKVNNENLSIEDNYLTIKDIKEGNYTFTLSKEESFYNKPLIFYQSNNSQNLVKTGDLDKLEISIKINVIKTSLELTKIDKDNQSIIPKGESNLDGAIYQLYDENKKEIEKLEIKNNQARIENLNFGTYYLKELSPGKGYTLDENTYKILITEKDSKIDLILENKVIEKTIIIEKKYGEGNTFQKEKNVSFQIFNKEKELIKTITTNEFGIAEVILPYGEYTFIQVNSKEGYQKMDPIFINVLDTEEERLELKDLKIKVPNTHTEKRNILFLVIQIFFILL